MTALQSNQFDPKLNHHAKVLETGLNQSCVGLINCRTENKGFHG